jgi:hypothetical protein
MLLFADMHAQIKSGYMIGLNLSTMTLKISGKSFEPEIMTGIHVGRIIEVPLRGNFTLQSGLLFSAKGSDAVKISLLAGPYFACGIGGNKESGGELKKISFGSDENRDLRLFDIGLNFGAGLIIKGLLISAQYELGLANLSPSTKVDTEMKSKVIGISVTTLFAGK